MKVRKSIKFGRVGKRCTVNYVHEHVNKSEDEIRYEEKFFAEMIFNTNKQSNTNF